MFSEIFYSKKTGEPVQIVAKCNILPDEIPGICFQQMSGEFECFVWDVEHFKANYQKEKIEKVKKEEPAQREEISDLVRFLDADTYREKMKILEGMKDDLNEHILNNMAVSLDLSLEDGVDGYSFLMSELKIRSRFEGKRGERL
ncbi:MAG TPA: hypothetical protein DEO89_05255 [Lachnospiraceae bacterium]|nr:hypothetical protein [Lachnospiraceae bacterium]